MSRGRPLGCVLAGGQSSRMGRDKSMLPYQGRPLVEHAVERLDEAGCEPVIAGSRPDLARYAPVIADLHPGCGPLGGIEAALAWQQAPLDPAVLFLPVDLPLLPLSFLMLLLDRAERTGALATFPVVGGRPQPLCAVYRRALLPGISAALAAGEHKVMRVLDSLAPAQARDSFVLEAVLAASGQAAGASAAHRWFTNLNHPADLDELTRSVGNTGSPHGSSRIH